MDACVTRVLLNVSYEDMKSKYSIYGSTMASNKKNICNTLQCQTIRQLQQRMKKGELSTLNLREAIQLYVKNHKLGRPTYLVPKKEYLWLQQQG